MMDDLDQDSLQWSSDDGRSISTTATDLEENYFSAPVDDSSLTSEEDIESAIRNVRALILETNGVSDDRKKLVKRLVELRLKLEDVKVLRDEEGTNEEDLRIVNNHQLIRQKQPLTRTPQYCDYCSGIVWTIIQNWYKCKGCHYQCHSKCLNLLARHCPASQVSSETLYISDICPEVGLAQQNYKCAECHVPFTLKSSYMEPRLCDYNGKYYCQMCHKNYKMSIPARILHNWDFEEKRVSECSRQFLHLMSSKPNMHVDQINPKLFSFVEELNETKRIREQIMIMKEYFMTCRDAIRQKLLRKLEEKQHFVENSYMYSLQDLMQVNDGSLVKYLEGIHAQFLTHIKDECQTCQGKGFICEICENVEVLFAFDTGVHKCPACHAVFHNICFTKREHCPKCVRQKKRSPSISSKS